MEFLQKTINDKHYVVAEPEKDIIDYQMKMISMNDIGCLVPAKKLQENDVTNIYYDVTNKRSLIQYIENRKISREQFIKIIFSITDAVDELREYQLVSAGLVFDADYIYISDNEFKPQFIYLPMYDDELDANNIKSFLLEFILKGKIEETTDNFVQKLLNVFNRPDLTVDYLKKAVMQMQNVGYTQPIQNKPINNPIQQNSPSANRGTENFIPIPQTSSNSISEKQKTKISEKKETKSAKKNGGKTVIFIIVQILLAAMLAGLALSGVINTEDGVLDVTKLAALILCAAAVDYVVFKNTLAKNASSEKKEKQAKPQKEKKEKSKNTASAGIAIPGKENIPPVVSPKAENKSKPESIKENVANDSYLVIPQADFEPTDIDSSNDVAMAYVEYVDEGITKTYYFNKPEFLVGRRTGSVDCIVMNKKVSNIHAKFVCRNGVYYVNDLNSKNGTYVNSRDNRIAGGIDIPINNNDRIYLSDTEFVLHC